MLSVVDDLERADGLRRMLSGYSHRCRNMLNGIKMSLYLFRREVRGPMPACVSEFERGYQEIERLFCQLQSLYRPMTVTMVRSPLGQLIAELSPKWRSWFHARGLILQLDPPGADVPGDFDPMQLGIGLDALIAWRAATGDARWHPRLSWRTDAGFFDVRWDEVPTQSTMAPSELDARLSQGSRSNASMRADCLALPLLARIVAAHGGGIKAAREPSFSLRVRWPQFQ